MKLEKVKYSKCKECGRGYPLAHAIPVAESDLRWSKEVTPTTFKKHSNKICASCIKKELKTVQNGVLQWKIKRAQELRGMLGNQNIGKIK